MLDRLANQAKRGLFYLIMAVTAFMCLCNIVAAILDVGVFWLEVSSAVLFGIFFYELCGLVKSNG